MIKIDLAICDKCAEEQDIHEHINKIIQRERENLQVKHQSRAYNFTDLYGNDILADLRKQLETLRKVTCFNVIYEDDEIGTVVLSLCKKHLHAEAEKL